MTNQQQEPTPQQAEQWAPMDYAEAKNGLSAEDQAEVLIGIPPLVEDFVMPYLDASWEALALPEGTPLERWLFYTRKDQATGMPLKSPTMWLEQAIYFPEDFAHQSADFRKLEERFGDPLELQRAIEAAMAEAS